MPRRGDIFEWPMPLCRHDEINRNDAKINYTMQGRFHDVYERVRCNQNNL